MADLLQTTSGRQKAFTEAYKPLHDRLARFVQSMVFNKEDVKDIIGETLLISYQKFETIRHEQALLSYMFTVASRLVYKLQDKKKQFTFVYDDQQAEKIVDTAASADLKIEVKDLYQALEQLPVKQREAIVLFEISGLSLTEIQELQGDTLSAVKSRIARARESLKKILEEEIAGH
jgi:RNA polymerase sigma-70 factor (ECF subfamily)